MFIDGGGGVLFLPTVLVSFSVPTTHMMSLNGLYTCILVKVFVQRRAGKFLEMMLFHVPIKENLYFFYKKNVNFTDV
jgi:hypothetical protein